MLEQDLYFFQQISREKAKRKQIEDSGNRRQEPNLLAISQSLDTYYFLDKLRLYTAFLGYSKIVNQKLLPYQAKDFLLIEQIIQLVESGQVQHPQIRIYNDLRKLYEQMEETDIDSDGKYQKLLALIQQEEHNMSADILEDIYSLLNNYCIRRLNIGEKAFRKNSFLISNKILAIRYASESSRDRPLAGSFFRNAIVAAVMLKETDLFSEVEKTPLKQLFGISKRISAYEWAKQFIDYFSPKLKQADHLLYVPYSMALVELEFGKVKKAYHILHALSQKRGMFINMNYKILTLKVLYELLYINDHTFHTKNDMTIEKTLDSLRAMIRDERSRKKEQSYHLNFYSTFIKLFNHLYRFHLKYDGRLYNQRDDAFHRDRRKLQDDIQHISYSYKNWFHHKLQQIN
ncbi:MAG: hypothetical protein AAFV25_14125 [Bacteroidota bacterium]